MKAGDKVEVLDPCLAMLRSLMGKRAKPNNLGIVNRIMDNGDVLVEFPIGRGATAHSQVAPYPPHMVRLRSPK